MHVICDDTHVSTKLLQMLNVPQYLVMQPSRHEGCEVGSMAAVSGLHKTQVQSINMQP